MTRSLDAISEHFAARGVAIIEYALAAEDLCQMDRLFPQLEKSHAGARSAVLPPQAQAWFARHDGLDVLAARLAGGPVSITRLQASDAYREANWFVPWGQAQTSRERPLSMLEETVALHIYLDSCDEDHGPLEVIPGTHLDGQLAAQAVEQLGRKGAANLCLAERGDIVVMRPLLLHRAQRPRTPAARRVIQIDYTRRAYFERVQWAAMAS